MRLRVTSLSGGLVEVALSEPDGTASQGKRDPNVQFIHESVNDYIESRGLSIVESTPPLIISSESHYRMLRTCVSYSKTAEVLELANEVVNFDWWNHSDRDRTLSAYPFLEYAVDHIWRHLGRCD